MNTDKTLQSGKDLVKSLRTAVARFYPCDLHTHTPGSYDVCQRGRFDKLPESLRNSLQAYAATIDSRFPLSRTPTDVRAFDENIANLQIIEEFYSALIQRRAEVSSNEGIASTDNWSIVACTDHNVSVFTTKLAKFAWERKAQNRLVVMPGIELDIEFDILSGEDSCGIHVLLIFPPLTKSSDIRIAINDSLDEGTWEEGRGIKVNSLAEFIAAIRGHKRYPCIAIAAHVGSSKGVQNEPTKRMFEQLEADVARLEGELERASNDRSTDDVSEIELQLKSAKARLVDEDVIHLEVLKIIGRCGFDALQVKSRLDESHYRRLHRFREHQGRCIPIVSSDAHTPADVFTGEGGTLFAKVSVQALSSSDPTELFSELRERVLRFGETRTTSTNPGRVSQWIEGIEIVPDSIEASQFWGTFDIDSDQQKPFTLELSRNLNCFVGGRGARKSAGLEAIAFLAGNTEFEDEGKQRAQKDWYSRARATLRNCHVRAVWKSTANDGIGRLPKRSLIVSRYFDGDDKHQPYEMRDVNDDAIVDPEVEVPIIKLLRVHEIERAAEPDNLRILFDSLCGSDLADANARIESERARLNLTRMEVLSVVNRLSELTQAGSAIRQYLIRKKQFEEVDKVETRARFVALDRANSIRQITTKIQEDWTSLGLRESIDQNINDFDEFVRMGIEAIPDDDGDTISEYTDLKGFLATVQEQSVTDVGASVEPSTAAQLREALLKAKEFAEKFESELQVKFGTARMAVTSQKDKLVKDGLPAGSGARDAKKVAYDESTQRLTEYDSLEQRLSELLKQRKSIRDQLNSAIVKRTKIRQTRAAQITEELSRDLDPSILRIEVVVKPQANQGEFKHWLFKNVGPRMTRSREARVDAIIKSGLTPDHLQERLLDSGGYDGKFLINSIERVDNGKIDAATAEKIFDFCQARRRVNLDEAEAMNEEDKSGLPGSIASGVVCYFCGEEENLSGSFEETLDLDSIVLDDDVEVYLNDRPLEAGSSRRPLKLLSPGQRCSAILPIMLLSGDYPLILDQPEENLDNRLVRQVIVNILAGMKLKRQVIIATHNPNLPVLGDAEQCVVLRAKGNSLSEVAVSGNLDHPEVARSVTDIMEGGREAFQYRQAIYQNHWHGPVDAQD